LLFLWRKHLTARAVRQIRESALRAKIQGPG